MHTNDVVDLVAHACSFLRDRFARSQPFSQWPPTPTTSTRSARRKSSQSQSCYKTFQPAQVARFQYPGRSWTGGDLPSTAVKVRCLLHLRPANAISVRARTRVQVLSAQADNASFVCALPILLRLSILVFRLPAPALAAQPTCLRHLSPIHHYMHALARSLIIVRLHRDDPRLRCRPTVLQSLIGIG